MIDIRHRLHAIRQVMEREHLDAIYLRPGANLSYLAGIRRREPHTTDTNAYGDWIEGAFIGSERLVLVAPRMGSEFFVQQARGKPWVTDVRVVLEEENLQVVLRDTLQRVAPRARRIAVDDRAWVPTLLEFQAAGNEVVPAGHLIAALRMVKSPDELDAMRNAARMADEVYAEVLKILRPGISETDVAHEVDHQFSRRGADYPSFVTGIRFTHPNSNRPHDERQTSRVLALGDAVTFDFGCVADEYCSDFGRTAFLGTPPSTFVRMHEAVLEAQRAAMGAMRADGVTAEEADRVARGVLREAGYADYFTHRLGHGIGVTVHEPPYLDVGDRTVLQANMTFTVEPSSRIPNGYACRVEDVVVVTPQGGAPLMESARTLAVIE